MRIIVVFSLMLNAHFIYAQKSAKSKNSADIIRTINKQLGDNNIDKVGDDAFRLYFEGLEVLKDSTLLDELRYEFYASFARFFTERVMPNEAIVNAKNAVFYAKKLELDSEVSRYGSQLAINHQRIKQYDSATIVFKEVIAYNNLRPPNLNALSVHNNFGIHYFEFLKNNDSAMVQFEKLYNYPDSLFHNQFLRHSIQDNMALIHMQNKKYAKAKPFFEDNYEVYGKNYERAQRFTERWIRAGLQLADVSIKMGAIAQGAKLLDEIEGHLNKLGNYGSYRSKSDLLFYKTKASYFQAIGNFKAANLWLKKREELWVKVKENEFDLDNKNHLLHNSLRLKRTKTQLNQEKTFRIEEEKFARKLKWFLVFIIIAGCSILFLLYVRYKLFKKAKIVESKLQEEQLQTQALQTKMLETENQAIKRDLTDFTETLIQRNKEKNILTAEYEKLMAQFGEQKDLEVLQDLAASKILTQDNWKAFKEKFNTAYPNYLLRLKNKGFQFTPAEERFIALQKLDLSTDQIANMLGVSQDSVRTSRYRLRKKLSIEKAISITEFLEK